MHAQTVSFDQLEVTNQHNMHVFALWEDSEVPAENPTLLYVNMHASCREASEGFKPGTFLL